MEKEPKQVDHDEARKVNLPSLISDEFGVANSTARMEIALGTVEVDGEEYTSKDKFNLPYDLIAGKMIVVKGESREFRIDYRR